MSAEMRIITVCFTVADWDRLPEGVTQDDVHDQVSDVIEKALDTWYSEKGSEYIWTSPVVG